MKPEENLHMPDMEFGSLPLANDRTVTNRLGYCESILILKVNVMALKEKVAL